jgi:hypothetical protein
MNIVLVHLHDDDLPTKMEDMRIWLDAHRVVPSRFRHQRSGVVQIDFGVRSEAEAFATKFAGRVISS